MDIVRPFSAIAPVRGGVVRIFFTLWVLGVAGVLAGLARTACKTPEEKGEATAALARRVAGWRVEHGLSADREMTPLVAGLLLRRGPRAGVDEAVYFERSEGKAEFFSRFSSAGWKTAVEDTKAGRSRPPQMRIFAPDGSLAWSGGYRLTELKSEGAALLDDVVLLRLARGESAPDHVPVGCSVPLRTQDENYFRWLRQILP